MTPHTRRHTLRRYRTFAIEFGPRAVKTRYKGETDNYSFRGMQFSSPVAMAQGDRIWIRAATSQKSLVNNLTGRKINAVVCWCHPEPKSSIPAFTVGVNF